MRMHSSIPPGMAVAITGITLPVNTGDARARHGTGAHLMVTIAIPPRAAG
jgi:hypothetical protein